MKLRLLIKNKYRNLEEVKEDIKERRSFLNQMLTFLVLIAAIIVPIIYINNSRQSSNKIDCISEKATEIEAELSSIYEEMDMTIDDI
ncbi:hypothetical protein [Treponema pectinovorum]|uniref:hypothetical protein n=1 Tax=Treponema pectinovorum TaxID=164 RepID=UPI001C07C81A|nr:hypothetical protein [Treponema pectinovorum]